MKWLIFHLFAFLCACDKVDVPTLERHEVQLTAVYGNTVVLCDITADKEVRLTYSYDLFGVEIGTPVRAYCKHERPIFVFLCDIENFKYYML